jgi:hypothetical protein
MEHSEAIHGSHLARTGWVARLARLLAIGPRAVQRLDAGSRGEETKRPGQPYPKFPIPTAAASLASLPAAAASTTPAPRRRSTLRRAAVGLLSGEPPSATSPRSGSSRPRSSGLRTSSSGWHGCARLDVRKLRRGRDMSVGRGCPRWRAGRGGSHLPHHYLAPSPSSGRGAGGRCTPSLPHVLRYPYVCHPSHLNLFSSRRTCLLLLPEVFCLCLSTGQEGKRWRSLGDGWRPDLHEFRLGDFFISTMF